MTVITVREFATLTTDIVENTLDKARITPSAFNWLCRINTAYKVTHAPAIADVEDGRHLQLNNYVGVLATPCGTVVEILPKIHSSQGSVVQLRQLVKKMITVANGVTPWTAEEAGLELFDIPVHEWVFSRFLAGISHILKRGVRSDYCRIDSVEPFLRGQLNVHHQMRKLPGQAHNFSISFDELSHNTPENRLISSALARILKATGSADSWSRAHEYHDLFRNVPPSINIEDDIARWRVDRLMAHYLPVKEWCILILRDQMPLSLKGGWEGLSLLYPMEKLYERYVQSALIKQLLPDMHFTAQSAEQYLCCHRDDGIFQLRPDFLIKSKSEDKVWVLDAKWKRVDSRLPEKKYQINEHDFYQMLAYAYKYMKGKGNMALIYPMWPSFIKPLPSFDFNDDLKLWVLPFDLEACRIIFSEECGLTNCPVIGRR